MNKELFPYLKSLSDLLTSAANKRIDSEVASMYIDLSKRLVDLMLIQNELSLVLEKKSLIKIPEAATKLEKVLPKSKNNRLLLQELKSIPNLEAVNQTHQPPTFLQIHLPHHHVKLYFWEETPFYLN